VGKKKLIVIWPYRFRDFDWQRFELDYLAPHIEIHVHELIDALTPEFGAAYANQSENPAVKRFPSLKEWREEFKKISKDAIVFNHVRPINLKSLLICATLRRSRASVIGFLLGGAVVPGPLKASETLLAVKVAKRAYHFFRRNFLILFMPRSLIVGGVQSEQMAKRDFARTVKPLFSNSFDYSQFLCISALDQATENAAVYLDTGFPGFPRDEVLTGRTEAITASDWYPNLNKFFYFVEKELELKVDVAIHPKHVGRDHSLLFDSRRAIGGQTASLVAMRKLVIATNSTAISFAICYNKPLILVWSDLIESGVDPRKKSFIKNFAAETGARIFNIDREYTEQDLREAMVIDHAKYESYKRKYLTSRTDGKPNYQVLLDEVIFAED
jgi:hypothetical protein